MPDEFVAQGVGVANPPTLLLAIDAMIADDAAMASERSCAAADGGDAGAVGECAAAEDDEATAFSLGAYLAAALPRLEAWVEPIRSDAPHTDCVPQPRGSRCASRRFDLTRHRRKWALRH